MVFLVSFEIQHTHIVKRIYINKGRGFKSLSYLKNVYIYKLYNGGFNLTTTKSHFTKVGSAI